MVDHVYSFDQLPDGLKHLKEQQHSGKLVMQVS